MHVYHWSVMKVDRASLNSPQSSWMLNCLHCGRALNHCCAASISHNGATCPRSWNISRLLEEMWLRVSSHSRRVSPLLSQVGISESLILLLNQNPVWLLPWAWFWGGTGLWGLLGIHWFATGLLGSGSFGSLGGQNGPLPPPPGGPPPGGPCPGVILLGVLFQGALDHHHLDPQGLLDPWRVVLDPPHPPHHVGNLEIQVKFLSTWILPE